MNTQYPRVLFREAHGSTINESDSGNVEVHDRVVVRFVGNYEESISEPRQPLDGFRLASNDRASVHNDKLRSW